MLLYNKVPIYYIAYKKQSDLLKKIFRGKMLDFYGKQILTEAGNRNQIFFSVC